MQRNCHRRLPVMLVVLFVLTCPSRGETAIGDWGHFISYRPRIHLANPDGRAFAVTVHVMQWGYPRWNRETHEVHLTAPDGTVLYDGEHPLVAGRVAFDITEGQTGVYVLEPRGNVWVSTTLERAVLWTGHTDGHMVDDRRAVFLPIAPRRWWFWVPPDTLRFTAKAQRADRYMSQREDWGFFIVTPRGQRIRALWGQPAPDLRPYRQEQEADVYVEPGAAGRFWAIEVQLGDSHDYSNVNLCLEGVPPYLAQSPETWFNPDTGEPAPLRVYDETPFIQSARFDEMEVRWPGLQHFSPCPSLGDPDGVAILGEARFALWNPERRPLGFRVGAYLPRRPKDDPDLVNVRITDGAGNIVFDARRPILHLHHNDGAPSDTLETGPGVNIVHISGTEHWMAYTYPATPLVLLGEAHDDGWHRYRFTACAPRNWYFFVPAGTDTFTVRVVADLPDDVLRLDVNAPDRIVAVLYGRQAEQEITVPTGLDGRIWHLRPSVGGASRLITVPGPAPRYQNIRLTLELQGLPVGLAPTWEQWFDIDDQ